MIKLKIEGNFFDCRIYDGYVFYLLEDGTLAIDDYRYCKEIMQQHAENVSLPFNNIREYCRQFDLSTFMPILDLTVNSDKLYVAGLKGLFQIDLPSLMRDCPIERASERKFDGKVIGLNIKQNKMLVSADYNGLLVTDIHGNGVGIRNVVERPVTEKSIASSWTKYDIINYANSESFDILLNDTETYEERKRKMFRLKQIGIEKIDMDDLLGKRRKYSEEKGIVFSYANNEEMYFLTNKRHLYKNKIKREAGFRLSYRPVRYMGNLLKETPLSMLTIGDYCVMELFDKVIACKQNGKTETLEEGGIMNVSKCRPSLFDRNVLVVTKQDAVSFIDFDDSPKGGRHGKGYQRREEVSV